MDAIVTSTFRRALVDDLAEQLASVEATQAELDRALVGLPELASLLEVTRVCLERASKIVAEAAA